MGLPENYYPTRHTRLHQLDRPESLREYRPVEAAAIDDEPTLCFDPVNVAWVRHIIGALHDLTDFRIWIGTDSDRSRAVQQIEQFLSSLKECPVCEDCPDPEQPPPPVLPENLGSGSSDEFGESGYSIRELEEMLKMAVTKIEWRNGELWYRDGCCDWYKVGTGSGSAVPALTGAAIAGALGGSVSIQDWEDQGEPNLAELLGLTHENAAYVTADSVRCAKATALVNRWIEAMEFIKSALIYLSGAGGGSGSLLVGYLITLVSWPAMVLITIAASITAAYAGYGVGTLVDQIDDWLNDDTFIGNLICKTTEFISNGTTIDETKDVKQLFYAWVLTANIDLSSTGTVKFDLYTIAKLFPIAYFREDIQALVSTTDCGCEAYLPYGYTPPVVSGAINFVAMKAIQGALNSPTPPSGDPYAQIDTGTPLGSKTGATSLKTQYQGVISTTYYAGFAALFRATEEITLNEVAFIADVSGTPGTGQTKVAVRVYTATGWAASGGGSITVNNTNDATHRITGLGQVGTDIYVYFQVSAGSSPNLSAIISNILFTGQVGGVGFLDRGIGQVLVP